MKLDIVAESWAYARPFKIAYVTRTELPLVHVRVTDDGITGQGEGIGVSYLGETQDSILGDLERVRGEIEAGVTRDALQEILPAGGARNALDCALWDLEAKRSGKSVFEMTGLPSDPVQSVYTISLDDPDVMAGQAAEGPSSHLKIKLNAEFRSNVLRRSATPGLTLFSWSMRTSPGRWRFWRTRRRAWPRLALR